MMPPQTEGMPPTDAMDPAVKRSGWQAPQDTGLWQVSDRVEREVWRSLSPEQAALLKACPATYPPPVERILPHDLSPGCAPVQCPKP